MKFLLTPYLNFKKEQLKRNRLKKHSKIIPEEAHNYLPEERPPERRKIYSRTKTVFAELREYNASFIAVDQQPSILSNFVLANTPAKVFFRLERDEDVEMVY